MGVKAEHVNRVDQISIETKLDLKKLILFNNFIK